jgi:hypothetical protein
MINTLKIFLSVGEEIDEAASERFLSNVLMYEDSGLEWRKTRGSMNSSISKWLLSDIVPAIEPFLIQEEFWSQCAMVCFSCAKYNPCLMNVLRNGGVSFVRWLLGSYIYLLTSQEGPLEERNYTEFELLAEYAGGLCFLDNYRGKLCSPLECAMRCGRKSCSKFVQLLNASSTNIHEVVQYEISVSNNAWTEDTLLALLSEEFTPYTEPDPRKVCKSCSGPVMSLQVAWDYPMQRRIRRAKRRMDPFSPPDEEEIRYQAAWETVVKDHASGFCFFCSIKRHKKKWPFLADLLE